MIKRIKMRKRLKREDIELINGNWCWKGIPLPHRDMKKEYQRIKAEW